MNLRRVIGAIAALAIACWSGSELCAQKKGGKPKPAGLIYFKYDGVTWTMDANGNSKRLSALPYWWKQ